MLRKLTKQEEELEKMGIERNKRELIRLNQQLEYNQDVLRLANEKIKLDDKWRIYLRELAEEENQGAIKQMKEGITIKENTIKISENHLKEGVTIKENKSVG